MLQVVSHAEYPIKVEDDVVVVRRRVRDLAHQRGLDSFATAAITTAASELARNVLTHAGHGVVVIEQVDNGMRKGIRLVFRDEGPGIENIDRALAGGFSTAKSLGLGLSGSKRLVDEFEIESAAGRGTSVTVVKWARY
jgi:serine/threonine-protein kinase RsbT